MKPGGAGDIFIVGPALPQLAEYEFRQRRIEELGDERECTLYGVRPPELERLFNDDVPVRVCLYHQQVQIEIAQQMQVSFAVP